MKIHGDEQAVKEVSEMDMTFLKQCSRLIKLS